MAVPGPLTPAFFDAQGQPVAITKMSTVGTASATNSISGRTLGDDETVDGDTMTEDDDDDDDDDEIMSMGTNYLYSAGPGEGSGAGGGDDVDAMMMMDDDNLDAASRRSVGGYEDRMSDDGSASLVGFGEGAGSTVSGPIYHRRPLPPMGSSAGAMASASNNILAWGALERTNSGLSDMAVVGSVSGGSATGVTGATGPTGTPGQRREFVRSPLEHFRDASGGGGSTSSGGSAGIFVDNVAAATGSAAGPSALQERRDVRLIDGMAVDGLVGAPHASAAEDDVVVDTTARGPVPAVRPGGAVQPAGAPFLGSIIQAQPSALRETQRPRSHQQQQQNQYHSSHNQSGQQGHHTSHHGSRHGSHIARRHSGHASRDYDTAEQQLVQAASVDGFEHGHDGLAASQAASGARLVAGPAAATAMRTDGSAAGQPGRFYF